MDDGGVTMINGYVPVIDVGRGAEHGPAHRAALAEAILRACGTSGFFVIVGHGVPRAAVDGVYRAARRFFGLPQDVKRAIAVDPADTLQRGWEQYLFLEKFCAASLGEGTEADGAADRFGLRVPNRWPQLPDFREVFLAYYAEMERLALELMRLIALGLGLPEHWFDDKFDGHMSPCALNHYLPQSAPPAPGELRNVPHADFGTLTVLYQDDAPGGLQVQDGRGGWLDVPAVPDSFVVNLGRLMSMWTNDRLTSTVHRVIHPPAGQAHRDRVSIAFFHQPAPEAVIEPLATCTDEDHPPRYAPVTSGDYFVARSRRLYVQRRLSERRGTLPKGGGTP